MSIGIGTIIGDTIGMSAICTVIIATIIGADEDPEGVLGPRNPWHNRAFSAC
jgi:hypothetical protein